VSKWGGWSSSIGLALALAACSEPVELGAQCELNSDCAEPLVCRYQRCREECSVSRDCALGSICLPFGNGLGACRLPDEAVCGASVGCARGLTCNEGQCTAPCVTLDECSAGDSCLPGPSRGGCFTAAFIASRDAGLPDAAPADAEATDSGTSADAAAHADAQATDAIPNRDAGPPDLGPPDTGVGPPDMGMIDVGIIDAGTCADPDPMCPGADLCADPRSCGECGRRCGTAAQAAPACVNGTCGLLCDDGWGDCDLDSSNGCEENLDLSAAHCGRCGSACPASLPICVDGDCFAAEHPVGTATAAFSPSSDIVHPPGVHHYASITIPAGVTVTSTGTGVLDLRSSGPILIAGTIDLSGGAGGDSGSTTVCDATVVAQNGGGGASGRPQRGADAAASGCRAGGSGGFGLPGNASPAGPCGVGGRWGGGAAGGPQQGAGGGGGVAGGGGGASGLPQYAPGGAGAASAPNRGGAGGDRMARAGLGGEPTSGVYAGGDAASCTPQASYYAGHGGGGGSIGIEAARDLAMRSIFRPGSAGGGGGGSGIRGAELCAGGGGGGGAGGALRLVSLSSITIASTGVLRADGGAGGDGDPTPSAAWSGAGGGGSGGAVELAAPSVQTEGMISTVGGAGGSAGCTAGAGGLGRVRVSVRPGMCQLSGLWTPPLDAGCTATSTPTPGVVYVGGYPF